MIKLSNEVQLTAAQYATQGNAILGLRGSGKSYSATFLAECLMGEKVPFTAFDPIGVWRNLKLPGKGPGFPVVVVGDDADLPLNQTAIQDIVRAAMREGVNLVIDLYSIKLSKAAWRDIVEQAVTIMLHENKSHGLRHIFIEEAAEFCPQMVRPDQAKVYSVMEKLARMGGNASLGYTLINQRAEAVNKEVLENCDMVFLHKQRGRNSITNLGKWLKFMAPEKADDVMDRLPHLKAGECFILDANSDVPQFVKMPGKSSFHPDRQNPTASKPQGKTVDVSGWIQRISDSIKKQEEKQKPKPEPKAAAPVVREVEKPVEVPVLQPDEVSLLTNVMDSVREMKMTIMNFETQLLAMKTRIEGLVFKRPTTQPRVLTYQTKQTAPRPVSARTVATADRSVQGGLKRMMIALAQRNGLTAAQLGVRAGLSSTSGTFGTYLAKGRTNGWLDGDRSNITITDEGLAALGDYEPLPSGRELLDYWLNELEGGARRMLEVLAEAYPTELTAEQVGHDAQISPSSGTFGTYLSKLRTLELVSGKRDGLKASDEFFQ